MPFNKYYLSAILAFVIWGFFSLILKPMHIYPALDILFYRVFCCAAILLVVNFIISPSLIKRNLAIYRGLDKRKKQSSVILSLIGGLLLTFNWFFFIYSLNNVSVKSAAYAYLICPILTTVLAYFILKEHLSPKQWAAVLLSLISCTILGYNHFHDLGYSLVVAASYAFFLISQRSNVYFEKFFILSIQMVFSALCLLPFFPFFAESTSYNSSFFLQIFLIAVFFTIVPLWLNLYALKGVSSSSMGILLYINPLLNFTMAAFYFNEVITTGQMISYGIIVISILIFNWDVLFKSGKFNFNRIKD